ncbi:DUF4349 domain-containing protein [Anaerobacillus isosaccharinicus]|uniref:DUF4349 domain-containing protein n=2 Tax=Anaerobacillus isosaccharinicus TaxID=1532552 RepID=A0A1S2MD91_9BACI|nr:DUF4349 domain-containing protein [Anaerobacillus isosaccharinicus]
MNVYRNVKLMLILIFVSILAACSSGYETSEESKAVNDSAPREERKIEQDYGTTGSNASDNPDVNVSERMVIYNANLSLEVKDYHKIEAQIQEKVSTLGGYVLESSIYFSGKERINGNLVVKVPQKSFQSFINEVESASVKVHDRHVSGNDVTEEFVDLESRLRSKRVVEERLLSFMEKAEQTEDLLKISSDLGKVQEEIEQLLGRMNYLKTNVDFSTVTLHLTENLVTVGSIQDKDLNTWVKAKSLFMESVNGLISLFSGIIVLAIGLSPFIVPLGLIGMIIVFYVRKKRNQKPFDG